MTDPSSALNAAVRAVHGESDLDAVRPALDEDDLARIIANAPGVHPVVQSIAALRSGLPSLLDQTTVADPALHAALVRLIGTPAGRAALWWWARVAPADWGRACDAALIDAVDRDQCTASAAAALIGPDDRTASRLRTERDIAFAIRWWGLSDSAAPDAWANMIDGAERERLLATVQRVPSATAFCLPWLPPDMAIQMRMDNDVLGDALTAFAAASPTARTQHAAILQRLVDHASPEHLAALTRLACAMQTDEVWNRVQTLIQASPEDAWRVVAEAPWDDLPDDVRAAILERADASDVCAAVAAAQRRGVARGMTRASAAAFFATLDPDVWDALDPAVQRRWLQHLDRTHTHLAVRSLGVRPEILAQASLTDDLACAVRRRARDDAALHWALMPVAAFGAMPSDAHAVIAALPTLPPDPGGFFFVASGHDDPSVIARARSALRTPGDLACAVALQRSTDDRSTIRDRCTALQHALGGRSYDDLPPFLALLTGDARAALIPDRDALVARLAHPDQRDALRHAFDHLASLPPEVAVPTCVALTQLTPWSAPEAAVALANALRKHGDLFVALADALANDRLRQELLPLPEDAALAGALRAMAHDAPPSARRLALALRGHSWRDALHALLHAPPQHAGAVWQALDDDAQRGIEAVVFPVVAGANLLTVRDMITAVRNIIPDVRDMIPVFAMAAVASGDDDLRKAGAMALARHMPLVPRSMDGAIREWGQVDPGRNTPPDYFMPEPYRSSPTGENPDRRRRGCSR